MKKILLVSSVFVAVALLLSGCNSTAPIGTDIAHKITKPGNEASVTGVQNDVKNAVIAVATYLATNPSSEDVSATPFNTSDPSTTITIRGAWDGYTVVGFNSRLNYTYSFDSKTGAYK